MSLPNGRARLLGQSQTLEITETAIAPALYIEIVTDVMGLPLRGHCLRIIDPTSQRAVFCPCTPQAARTIAAHLLQYADEHTSREDPNGSATVHEQ